MDYRKELYKMRKKYVASPMKEKLPRPGWLTDDDDLSLIYKESERLYKNGNVYYGCIVQANKILFKRLPYYDCPAEIIYSAEEAAEKAPSVFTEIAHCIYRYKNDFDSPPPEKYRDIVKTVRNEYDRSSFSFHVNNPDMEMKFASVMVFRRHIPTGILKGRIIPVLAAPDCSSVIILPKRYWTVRLRLEYARKGL